MWTLNRTRWEGLEKERERRGEEGRGGGEKEIGCVILFSVNA